MKIMENLLERLAEYPNSETVFNPYREPYAIDNLRHYFEYIFNHGGKRILLVGEAPGYKGCRITGIPFTSGRVFQEISHPLLISLKDKIHLPQIETERTATIVWNYLSDKQVTPLFWNSFPFHPYEKEKSAGNRAPTAAEVKIGAEIIIELNHLYKPELMAGIGHKGVAALRQIFPEKTIEYIRHPSRGGKPEFINGMNGVI